MTITEAPQQIQGYSLIGAAAARESAGIFHARDASSGMSLEPAFHGAVQADLQRACGLAEQAFDDYRQRTPEVRAQFLETIAQEILDLGDPLIVRAMAETGLPRARLEGERGRTVGQLRFFAAVVRDGSHLDVRVDPALPERTPVARPDLRLQHIGLGPVAVFGASNFPLAFSVAGGDTASALAAGCTVIVKAHPAHPGVSELVGRAIQRAVTKCSLPEGVFSLLFDAGVGIGQALVADARVKAVGFTGSRGAGLAIVKIAGARPEPIPVYAEMSSVNPVLLFPGALAERGEAIGKAFVASLTLGAGQFCTSPGLVLAIDGPGLDRFVGSAITAVANAAAQTMLTSGIRQAYRDGVAKLAAHPRTRVLARGGEGADSAGRAALFETDGEALLGHAELAEEVFGSAAVLVRCRDETELAKALDGLEGQLTIAVHANAGDYGAVQALMPLLERRAGRILFNGFGTGVEVAHAMVHGGPFPATSDGRTTSVGSLAISRFLRPVCYQDVPAELLPPSLDDANPFGLPRRINGTRAP